MRAVPEAPALTSLKPFDSCVTLGRIVHSKFPEYLTPENVLEVMDRYHIEEALVHSQHARAIYPRRKGNRQLLDRVGALPAPLKTRLSEA